MQGEPKPHQMKIKSEKGEHKSEMRSENKGDKKYSQAGAKDEKGRADIYRVGLTRGMHGNAKGGHPTKRAEEMC